MNETKDYNNYKKFIKINNPIKTISLHITENLFLIKSQKYLNRARNKTKIICINQIKTGI